MKPNVEIFRALSKRLGFDDACFDDSEDDMIRSLLNSDSAYLKGITLEKLKTERSVRLNVSPAGQPFLPFAHGDFKTNSGKFEFGSECLVYTPPVESRFGDSDLTHRYPLELISAKNDDSMNSTLGHRAEVDAQTAILQVHPDDAAARGIVDGMLIQARNDRGACYFNVRLSANVRPGVVRAHSTRWSKSSVSRLGINQLTSERLTDIAGGPTFYSCLVDVLPVTKPKALPGTNPDALS